MSDRMRSEERRTQVARVVMELLSEVPLHELSTRLVAERIGISQPALFKHFKNRDEMILEAVSQARSRLAEVATSVIEEDDAFRALSQFTLSLFEFVSDNPGLPRLLFFDASGEEADAPYRVRLRALLSMQTNLVKELIKAAQGSGQLSQVHPPEVMSELYVSLIVGSLLKWHQNEQRGDLKKVAEEVLILFSASSPSVEKPPKAPPAPPSTIGQRGEFIVTLDVRSILQSGVDPLGDIQQKLGLLRPGGVFELLAPFRPEPLLALLKKKGFSLIADEPASGLHRLWAFDSKSAELLDLRELEAPEPMQHVLEAAALLSPGAFFCAAVPQLPRLLFPHLAKRGLSFTSHESIDGCALISVCRPE